LFLSASEHEGFCVPLIEAFHKRIPVVAYASTAVPTTMDGAGVLYETKDPRHVAAIMDTVLSNPALESEIVRGQDAALDRLLAHDFERVLCEAIDQVSRSARLPRTEVRWDFWQRFADWERLEELRLYRPSAYKALPFAPGERGENP
jgi:glycosyltransferase involved in cell wall biosynthesis